MGCFCFKKHSSIAKNVLNFVHTHFHRNKRYRGNSLLRDVPEIDKKNIKKLINTMIVNKNDTRIKSNVFVLFNGGLKSRKFRFL